MLLPRILVMTLLLFIAAVLDYQYQLLLSPLDESIAEWFYTNRTPLGTEVFTFITNFGDWLPIIALLTVICALLITTKRYGYLTGLLFCMAFNQISLDSLKLLFARPRQELSLYIETSYSFPSGHSAGSMAFFGFLVFILVRERCYPRWSVLTGGAIIALIGLSRLYLNAHYLIDVLAGYLHGGIWLILGMLMTDRIANRQPNLFVANNQPLSATQQWLVVIIVLAGIALMSVVIANETHPLNTQPSA